MMKKQTASSRALWLICLSALSVAPLSGCSDEGGTIPVEVTPIDEDGDGVPVDLDCDDEDPDRSAQDLFYEDQDGDGLGDGSRPTSACDRPPGHVTNADDLEPECATNNTDECGVCGGTGGRAWFADVDGDGLGDERIVVEACEAPEGFVDNGDDPETECATNDTDECGVCAGEDGDKDCRGVCFGLSLLDGCGVCDGPGPSTWYPDVDRDGLGDARAPLEACERPEGFVDNSDDLEPECTTNDTDECGVCAGPGPGTWYPDVDQDGLGDSRSPLVVCTAPEGFVDNGDDPEPACTTNDTDLCSVCGGGNLDMDCHSDCFGEAFVDGCERCVGGETGLEEAIDDFDDDGVPDLCDPDCMTQRRYIVQWTGVPPFNANEGGPYTFQLVLFESGDILFQYGIIEPYQASSTVGIQDSGGEHFIEFGFNSPFLENQPTVWMERDGDERFIADYSQELYWLDIQSQGEAIRMNDDQIITMDLGFEFPFYGGVYTEIAVSSNGFVAFEEPHANFTNQQIPNENLGAFIAPFWDDLNPARGGTVHVLSAGQTCDVDCNGVVGGFSVLGECDTCLTGLEQGPLIDCNGVCGGEAALDGCGRCTGGDTGLDPLDLDCNEVCGGEAFVDGCRVCVGGDTGVEPSDPDECPQGVDMIVDQTYLAQTVRIDHVQVAEDDCLIQERCVGGPGDRKVIRFGTRIANIGTEDLQLGRPNNEGEFWHFDECHNHFHFEAYADYRLFDVANQETLEIGSKNGFCVLDSGVYDPNIATNGCSGYNCGNQGITAGCQDTYGPGLQCQWIDVTGLDDGLYEVIVTTNPDREIPEISFDNNSARVRVRLEGEEVTVIEE